MKTWLLERWTDPAKFTATVRAAIYIVGELFERNVIPTGVPGGGHDMGALLKTVAIGMAAGDRAAP